VPCAKAGTGVSQAQVAPIRMIAAIFLTSFIRFTFFLDVLGDLSLTFGRSFWA
jgi:hypothetical protein